MVTAKEDIKEAIEESIIVKRLSTNKNVVIMERTTLTALLPTRIVTNVESKCLSTQRTSLALREPLLALTSNLKRFIEEKTVSAKEKNAEPKINAKVRIKYIAQVRNAVNLL